jgi:hypothetical protein
LYQVDDKLDHVYSLLKDNDALAAVYQNLRALMFEPVLCTYYYKLWHSGVEAVFADSVADLGDEEVEDLINIFRDHGGICIQQSNRK